MRLGSRIPRHHLPWFAALASVCLIASVLGLAQSPAIPDWPAVERETLEHFQQLLRFDTSDPPGREEPAAAYLRQVLEAEGIPVQLFTLEPGRPNVVARLSGSGRKRPLLLMAHTDVVNVDVAKWKFPPFGATRDGGYIYARGTLDDKDNVAASLMTMLLLQRLKVPLDRDVIFLAEAGEEGSTRVGIQFMVNEHYPAIDAEYCLAETGSVTRSGGEVRYASVQTLEKQPRAIELTARGPAGHGSVPLTTNAIVRLAAAVAAVGEWRAPIRLNETTGMYFKRLADISPRDAAARYRDILSLDPDVAARADRYFQEHEPLHASMLRTSAAPTIIDAGYRVNVIPSEAKATLDVRLLPGDDPEKVLDQVRQVVNDPSIDVSFARRDLRPPTPDARLDTEVFATLERSIREHYKTVTLPMMSTGATDMAFLRAKGMQCYGVGPAIDIEDAGKGFGSHSDQERILESELHRFVRFYWDVVREVAGE
jgi:acetylornithine deacetylase/succinyl-diaminopimelate desuccinylase-like protein